MCHTGTSVYSKLSRLSAGAERMRLGTRRHQDVVVVDAVGKAQCDDDNVVKLLARDLMWKQSSHPRRGSVSIDTNYYDFKNSRVPY